MKRSKMVKVIEEELIYYAGSDLSKVNVRKLSEMLVNRIQCEGMLPPTWFSDIGSMPMNTWEKEDGPTES